MIWEVDVYPKRDRIDSHGQRVAADATQSGLSEIGPIHTARAFLICGSLTQDALASISQELLVDPVLEDYLAFPVEQSDYQWQGSRMDQNDKNVSMIQVLRKPGVMDPVAHSCLNAIRDCGYPVEEVRTLQKYWIQGPVSDEEVSLLAHRVLANESIEQVIIGELNSEHLVQGVGYEFSLVKVPLRNSQARELIEISHERQLSLNESEMKAIQSHFLDRGGDPTDIELETIAQTWSEHCSHKTLKGRIHYQEMTADGKKGTEIHFDNLLKETVFSATQQVRSNLGPDQDWCVSVFEDNAGIVQFDDQYHVCFKVETHNHPSAIEPYGGANTGLGGVIRDILGTGLGARPVANTDVFCFAPPDTEFSELPPGVLHPKRVMRGVVSGVRDYGNRMGIPTVNGAVFFDPRYVGNPLVYCGTVGTIPVHRCEKQPMAGDWVVAMGGRTGRDGLHGATFSSLELTHESEAISGGAVQIGNPITEKMLLDVLLVARDRGLYTAITDCGAGGFSSAVGEMGAEIGAEIWLERVPLKYEGLSYTEIWISEAQERMVLSVPPHHWEELRELCESEDVEVSVIGEFQPTGRLVLKYQDTVVGDLDMHFLHQGCPRVVREAQHQLSAQTRMVSCKEINEEERTFIDQQPDAHSRMTQTNSLSSGYPEHGDFREDLLRLLASLNICSKEWVIRQYDHEVRAGTVVKPLVGVHNDGPSDASVIRPVFGSSRGLAIACGMNPRYGELDPYWMAASAIDEAVRNCIAVGADPDRIALLDNFCWGNTDYPETLGSLVRAALACSDVASRYGTPFISGKDSLNNEFRYELKKGVHKTINIPPSLLISALGQVADVHECVTMDFKEPGNLSFLVGKTSNELGGSHYEYIHDCTGGFVPMLNTDAALKSYRRLHLAIKQRLVRSCHDLSEGGLAVSLAEMAFSGECGAWIDLQSKEKRHLIDQGLEGPAEEVALQRVLLFSESNSRFLVEVSPDVQNEFIAVMEHTADGSRRNRDVEFVGRVLEEPKLKVTDGSNQPDDTMATVLIEESIQTLKECWKSALNWGS